MTVPSLPRFSQLADQAGLGIADVAVLAGVEESTVSRLWSAPDWLDRVRGRTLQALIAYVPGIAEYVADAPHQARFAQLVLDLAGAGVTVDVDQAARLPAEAGLPRPYVVHALEACLRIVRGDVQAATDYLPRFWGRAPDSALAALFRPAGGLLVDVTPLLAAGAELAPQLNRSAYSFNAIMARSQLAHHVARATGQPPDLQRHHGELDRQTAVALRSSTMGALAASDDPEPADRYRLLVDRHRAAELVEEWALPSWTRDCRPTMDMTLPGSLLLRGTAAEVLREIDSYGAGYLHYLVTVYVPRALELDPTFGLRVTELRTALFARRETVAEPAIRRSVDHLARTLPTGAP
jgi:hypothetical protein